jgi:membrane protein implicated in regulation of membrane protease activity
MRSGNWQLFVFTLGVAVVVGAIVSLAIGSWWVLAAALIVHLLGTALMLVVIRGRLEQEDKPDPVTEARLEERHSDLA